MVKALIGVVIVVISGISGIAITACKPKPALDAILPPETPLFVKDGIGYGVVNVSFAHVLKEAGGAAAAGLLRKGSVIEIVERRRLREAEAVSGETQLWLYVVTRETEDAAAGIKPVAGWLPGASVDFYESLPKAVTAAALMPR
jgi:hypothetical protein